MLRITSGRWSGRRLQAAPGTRPTAERVREALFSIWGQRVARARFADLFCGSGAVGLEALSRGAAAVELIDEDAAVLRVARRNVELLEAGKQAHIRRLRLPRGLAREGSIGDDFDLIFADPPYGYREHAGLLTALARLLAPGGEIALEHGAGLDLSGEEAGLERISLRSYGRSALSFYRLREAC